MLKITGVILCIAGCTGYGLLKIANWKKALLELEQWILLFQKMKSHIHYQRDRLEEICVQLNQDMYGLGGYYAAKAGESALEKRTVGFAETWKEQMELWKLESVLPSKIKELIFHFSDYSKEADYELQMSFLDMFVSNLEKEKSILENQLQEKRKPVMTMSVAGGLVIAILLL